MADGNLTQGRDGREHSFEEKIYDHIEWRIGTKSQLQRLGIGVGIAFPGEPGANKFRMTTRDHRGYSVKVEVREEWDGNSRTWDGRYRAVTHIPDSVQQERQWQKKVNAEESVLISILREHDDDIRRRIIGYALNLSIQANYQWSSAPPKFRVGDIVRADHWLMQGVATITRVDWHAGDFQSNTGWVYTLASKNAHDRVFYERNIFFPEKAQIFLLQTAAPQRVKQVWRGRYPKSVADFREAKRVRDLADVG